MAKLTEETLKIAFNLEKRLLQITDQASNLGFMIWEAFGETDATVADLDILQSVTEQARANYTRLTNQLFELAVSRSKSNLMTLDSLSHYCLSIEASISRLEGSIALVKSNHRL